MANEIHTLNVGNTSYTIQPRVLGPMSTFSNGAPCPSVSGVIRYDAAIGDNPFGLNKSTGYNNAVLSIGRHDSDRYTTQLGFSGFGMYARWFNDKTPDATTPWRRFIMDDGDNTLHIDTPNVNVDASSISLEATNINIADGISTLYCTKLKLSNNLTLNGSSEELEYIYTGLQMPVSIKPLTLSYNSITYPVYVHFGEDTDGNLERGILFNMCTDSVNLQRYPSSKTYHVWVAKSQYDQLIRSVNSGTLDHLTTYKLVFTNSSTPGLYTDYGGYGYGMTVAGRGSYVWTNNVWDDLGVWDYTDYFIRTGFVESNKWIIFASEVAEACAVMTSAGYDSNGVMDGTTDINIESKEVCTINSNDVNINGETDINIESHENCAISSGGVNINGQYIGIGSNTSHCETIEIGTLGEQEVFINGREINIAGGECYINTTLHAAFIEAQSTIVSTVGTPDTPFAEMYTEYGFYQSSDERLKTFGDNIKVDLDALSKLRKAYFTWNDNPDTTHIGVSAQEIKEIYPEIVSGDDRLTVDYTKLSVIALAAVDELHKKNVELEARLAKLEAMLLK